MGSKRPHLLSEAEDEFSVRSVKRAAIVNSDYEEDELEASDAAKDTKSDSEGEEADDDKVIFHFSSGPQELSKDEGA